MLGFKGLALSKSCESSLYTQRLARLQRKLPPQGIYQLEPTRKLFSPYIFQDTSSRSFSLWRRNIGLAPMWAFIRASKVSRTYQHGPRVIPESIPPTVLLMNLLGTMFMRYVAVRKALSQNFSGMDALARRARPISTMW